MSLFGSIATAVVGKGVSKLLSGKKKQAESLPKMTATKFRYSKDLRSTPTQSAGASTSSQIDRLISRHEAIMSSFNVGEGAVSGKYGSLKI